MGSVLGLLIYGGSVTGAQAKAAGCPPKPHYGLVAKGPRALVAATRYEQYEDEVTAYRACLRSRRTSYVIDKASVGLGGTSKVGTFRFAGRFVAWLNAYSDPRYGGGGESIRTFDLRNGKRRSLQASSHVQASERHVIALVVSTRGHLAWLLRDASRDTLFARADGSRVRLDQAPHGQLHLVAFRGQTVRWTNGTQPRTATPPGP